MRLANVVAGLMLVPCTALAQQQQPDTVRPVPLAPITVTVVRMPLDAGRVPYAVAAVDAQVEGRAQPGLALDEALRAVPGVQVDNRYNYALGERVSIRGFGARAQFGVRGVKVLLDGIPATVADGQTTLNHIDLGSLGRVEVIRGPAASLYGNAAGGVIQLETARPPAVPIQQELSVIGGDDGLLRVQSRTAGQSGRLDYQASVARLRYDGYRAFGSARNVQADAQVRYAGARDILQLTANFVDYDARNPGSLSDSLLRVDRSQAFANNVRQQTGEEGWQAQLGGSWRRPLTSGELELAAYGVLRSLDNPIPVTIIDLQRTGGGVRALYRNRLGIAGREALWTVGSDVDLQYDDRKNYANVQGARGDLTLDQEESVRGMGVFGQLSLPLTDRLGVLASLRYDAFRFSADDRLIQADDPDDSGERTMDALNPSVGVTWSPAEAVDLYANFATSFQTPTTTELVNRPSGSGGFNPDLEPERTRAFEVGARGHHRSIAFQLAAYRALVEDALIGFEVPQAAGRTFYRNAGSAVHRGFEAGVGVATRFDLDARLSYTYTDARFRDYTVGDAVYDDNRLPGVAPHRLEGVVAFGPGLWFAELNGRYVSRIVANDANTASSPPYAVFDVRAGLESTTVMGMRVAPFVGVSNVLDRRYNTSLVINAFGGRFFEPGPGRAFHAGARVVVGSGR